MLATNNLSFPMGLPFVNRKYMLSCVGSSIKQIKQTQPISNWIITETKIDTYIHTLFYITDTCVAFMVCTKILTGLVTYQLFFKVAFFKSLQQML